MLGSLALDAWQTKGSGLSATITAITKKRIQRRRRPFQRRAGSKPKKAAAGPLFSVSFRSLFSRAARWLLLVALGPLLGFEVLTGGLIDRLHG